MAKVKVRRPRRKVGFVLDTAYDAAHLDLAIRRGLPLATIDGDLKRASSAVGVELYQAM
jgi:hypothetical protein